MDHLVMCWKQGYGGGVLNFSSKTLLNIVDNKHSLVSKYICKSLSTLGSSYLWPRLDSNGSFWNQYKKGSVPSVYVDPVQVKLRSTFKTDLNPVQTAQVSCKGSGPFSYLFQMDPASCKWGLCVCGFSERVGRVSFT